MDDANKFLGCSSDAAGECMDLNPRSAFSGAGKEAKVGNTSLSDACVENALGVDVSDVNQARLLRSEEKPCVDGLLL